MFYLFVCLTQDGWVEIFKAFQVKMIFFFKLAGNVQIFITRLEKYQNKYKLVRVND